MVLSYLFRMVIRNKKVLNRRVHRMRLAGRRGWIRQRWREQSLPLNRFIREFV